MKSSALSRRKFLRTSAAAVATPGTMFAARAADQHMLELRLGTIGLLGRLLQFQDPG